MRNNTNIADLVDIRDIKVDGSLPDKERVIEFYRKLKNPNRYKCGRFNITAIHPKNAPRFAECLTGMTAP